MANNPTETIKFSETGITEPIDPERGLLKGGEHFILTNILFKGETSQYKTLVHVNGFDLEGTPVKYASSSGVLNEVFTKISDAYSGRIKGELKTGVEITVIEKKSAKGNKYLTVE